MPTNDGVRGAPLIERLLDAVSALSETNSFLAAVITEAVTIGHDWVTFDSYVPGPTNYEVENADMAVAEDGSGIAALTEGSFFCAANFHLLNPTGDGGFQAALNPIGICTPQWPDDDVNKGRNMHDVHADRFAWPDYTPGYSPPSILVPCLVGDIITPSCRYSSADSTETIDVKGLLYVWKVQKGGTPS